MSYARDGGPRRGRTQAGQSLLETALALPLLLALVFNAINFGYFWYVILSLSSAPRHAAQYASQGGDQGTPAAATIAALVTDNLNATLKPAVNSIRVCASSVGVVNPGTNTQKASCSQTGSYSFPDPGIDPEAPAFILHRVDVEYTVTPIIPGGAFNVILPSTLEFHRQVSMRSLY